MSTPPNDPGPPPTEEELRAAYEAEIKRLRVDDLLVQTVVSLVNLGARKAALVPGTEGERDLEQVRQAVEATRALLPIIEPVLGKDAGAIRDALSQLQLAYARAEGPAAAAAAPAPDAEAPAAPAADDSSGAGPAQSSGRLWVPGQ